MVEPWTCDSVVVATDEHSRICHKCVSNLFRFLIVYTLPLYVKYLKNQSVIC